MKNIILSFCFILLIFLTCCNKHRSYFPTESRINYDDMIPKIKIQGTVTDSETRLGIEGVVVSWGSSNLDFSSYQTLTANNGEYNLNTNKACDFSAKFWYLRATKNGYHSFIISIGEVKINCQGEYSVFDIELTKI